MHETLLEMPTTALQPMAQTAQPDLSIIIVSFNTRNMTRQCLKEVAADAAGFTSEIIVVENASRDGSADMIRKEFQHVQLLESSTNLGFGNANNLALEHARGRFYILLNSDAFLKPGSLALAVQHMEQHPDCGLGGGLLVGRDGEPQPSARCFHSLWGDFTVLTGLAARFPATRLCGHFDRTWADRAKSSKVDWVPGAFCIVRPAALRKTGLFDPNFFLYYEEVDLCLRMKQAGYTVWYWPDVVITHIGGESSRQLKTLDFSAPSSQVVLWRMRSTLLYYRKHRGPLGVRLAYRMEQALYFGAAVRNRFSRKPARVARKDHFETMLRLLQQAWNETEGGKKSPPQPW